MASSGNNRVVYLKYANAEEMVDVLKGVSDNLQAEKQGNAKATANTNSQVMISAHVDTNSLILTAPPDIMRALENIIAQLDIRRAQVLIEAMIVELAEGDGVNFGVQWGSTDSGGVIQFGNSGVPISSTPLVLKKRKNRPEQKPSLTQIPVRKKPVPSPRMVISAPGFRVGWCEWCRARYCDG